MTILDEIERIATRKRLRLDKPDRFEVEELVQIGVVALLERSLPLDGSATIQAAKVVANGIDRWLYHERRPHDANMKRGKYHRCKKSSICPRCGKKADRRQRVFCSKCAATQSRRDTARRRRRLAEGKCSSCGGERNGERFLQCLSCRKRNREYQREWWKKRQLELEGE